MADMSRLPPLPGPPIRIKKRTMQEKRSRMSGKNTNKPYISSSLGDMCRHMIRLACTENTLGMTDPPPLEFYDYWHKFTIDKKKLPADYVDLQKVSIPRLKMNTSSFDLFGKNMSRMTSAHQLGMDSRNENNLAPALSDLWKDVRISMSSESFISSSTKVSEKQDNVPLGLGWSDGEEEDLLSDSENEMGAGSDSSFLRGGLPEGMHASSHAAGPGVMTASKRQMGDQGSRHGTVNSVTSYQSETTKQNKGMGAIAISVLQMELEEQRVAMENALKPPKDRYVVDHFMDDLDDSFLKDALSYGLLPDAAFNPDFDYFNEDPIYRERERERERLEAEAVLILQGKDPKDNKPEEVKKLPEKKTNKSKPHGDASELSVDTSEDDSDDSENPEKKSVGIVPVPEVVAKTSVYNYETCLVKQRKRIEDNLRAAVRCRSPMGSYKVPKGGLPLARTFGFKTPGPAKYNPKINATKPNPPNVFFAKRWSKSIYDTPGPGPAAYIPTCRCTAVMRNLHEAPRFKTSETVGPGPAEYDVSQYCKTSKDKPHALILSRRPELKIGCGSTRLTNVYGISRFGLHNSPKALIISRHYLRDRNEPGPGDFGPDYHSNMLRRKIGISMKSRIPLGEMEESPGFHMLPGFIGKGPGVPLGIRKFQTQNPDSPGPIYMLPSQPKKPVSLTFRPFPMQGRESEPSPIEYGTKPGDMAVKFTHPRAPEPVMCGSHDLKYGHGKSPGPNKYKIRKCDCKEGIVMKGRWNELIEVMPGPSDYKVGDSHLYQPPRAVFQHKPKEKKVKEKPSPGFKYNPYNPNHKIKGGLMAPRWTEKDDSDDQGPQFVDLFGFTSKGKYSKIPITLKSRNTPFMYTHVADNPEIPKRNTCGIETLNYSQKKGNQKRNC